MCLESASDGVVDSAVEFENNVALSVSCWIGTFMFFLWDFKTILSLIYLLMMQWTSSGVLI